MIYDLIYKLIVYIKLIILLSILIYVCIGTGNLFGWGTNDQNQIGVDKFYNRPNKINNNEKVRVITCGKTSTIFITGINLSLNYYYYIRF